MLLRTRLRRLVQFGLIATFAMALALYLCTGIVLSHRLYDAGFQSALPDSPERYGLQFEDIAFQGTNNNTLKGWFLPANNHSDRAVILTHGAYGNRTASAAGKGLEFAGRLVDAGYNVLMYDMASHGESTGKILSYGYYEGDDVLQAVAFLGTRGIAPEHIGLIGWSVGADASLHAAAMDRRIPVVIADGALTSLPEFFDHDGALPLQAFLEPTIALAGSMQYGVNIRDIRPIDWLQQVSPRYVLLIYGHEEPLYATYGMGARMIEVVSQNQHGEYFVVNGAGHTGGYLATPDEYFARVVRLFDKAIK